MIRTLTTVLLINTKHCLIVQSLQTPPKVK